VEDESGHFALRVHRENYNTDAALRSELQWMQALDQYGVRTPNVIPALDGDLMKKVAFTEVPGERQVDVLAWIDGEVLGHIGEEVEDVAVLIEQYRKVGEIAGELHNQASNWVPPQDFERRAWDEEGLIGENPIWGKFWELEYLSEQQRELVLAVRDQARETLKNLEKGNAHYGLVHTDFMPENLMVESDGTIRVFDFDDAGYSWYLYEFGAALFAHYGQPYYGDLKASMVEGYRRSRPLSAEHVDMIQDFVVIRVLVSLGWLHTRREIEGVDEFTAWLVDLSEGMFTDYLAA